jgi:hypothetical protein
MNKSNCQVWKKFIFDWLGENPGQDLFGGRPENSNLRIFDKEQFAIAS